MRYGFAGSDGVVPGNTGTAPAGEPLGSGSVGGTMVPLGVGIAPGVGRVPGPVAAGGATPTGPPIPAAGPPRPPSAGASIFKGAKAVLNEP